MIETGKNTAREELMTYLLVAGILLLGYLVSALLGYLMPDAAAKGLGFFVVSLSSYFVLWKKRRVGVVVAVGLSVLIGLLFFVGEFLLSRH